MTAAFAPPAASAGLWAEVLLELGRRVRAAADPAELAFMVVNDSRVLAPYRQAALWFAEGGVRCLSGVVQVEANAPYVQWLARACAELAAADGNVRRVSAASLPAALAQEWAEWLPEHALWLPLPAAGGDDGGGPGGVLLARDTAWADEECALFAEWRDIWHHGWLARQLPSPWSWRAFGRSLRRWWTPAPDRRWWAQTRLRWAVGLVVVLCLPVRLSVLAPAELVPAEPAVIRAPLDGVVGSFQVRPNEMVKAGQALFGFDEAPLQSRLDVARQALATAEAEYRQSAQLAVSDAKYKGQLAILTGKIEERRAEADYLQGQLERSRIVSPRDGIALFDDPSEWIGKPVVTGERIMRIAAPDDVEIEAWLGVGDAIPVLAEAPLTLYLNASPLSSVAASVRYVAHDAVQRPDGNYAYRVRARLHSPSGHRVGLKGTAKLSGDWVPLAYWVMRRPLAAVRQATGW